MPHASGIMYHSSPGADLVTLSFSVPADKVTLDAENVLIRTGTDSVVITVPKTLMTETVQSGYVVFRAQVPSDIAVAVTSICSELFQLPCNEQPA